MKYTLILAAALVGVWLLWSGHFDKPFIIGLGLLSVIESVWLSRRMRIVDEEGAPVQLGIRPFLVYAPWLAKEIFISNLEVTKIILSPRLPTQRNMVTVTTNAKSQLGRVILANSITLTPGTVSISLDDDQVLVHALSFDGAAEDISGEMDRRVQALEKRS